MGFERNRAADRPLPAGFQGVDVPLNPHEICQQHATPLVERAKLKRALARLQFYGWIDKTDVPPTVAPGILVAAKEEGAPPTIEPVEHVLERHFKRQLFNRSDHLDTALRFVRIRRFISFPCHKKNRERLGVPRCRFQCVSVTLLSGRIYRSVSIPTPPSTALYG